MTATLAPRAKLSPRAVARYRVTFGLESTELEAEDARADWDDHPPYLRTGLREGAFILWLQDCRGCRVIPVIYKPVRA